MEVLPFGLTITNYGFIFLHGYPFVKASASFFLKSHFQMFHHMPFWGRKKLAEFSYKFGTRNPSPQPSSKERNFMFIWKKKSCPLAYGCCRHLCQDFHGHCFSKHSNSWTQTFSPCAQEKNCVQIIIGEKQYF